MIQRSLVALSLALSLSAFADADVEAQVDAYLGSLDAPIKTEQWRALGPEAIAILERHAFSDADLPTVRARATEALGLVGSPVHGDRLLSIAGDSGAPLIVRLSAVRGAARLLPESRMAEALTSLLQADTNGRVRATAADVLADRLGARGCVLVDKQLKTESPAARGMFTSAKRRCAKLGKKGP